MYNRFTLRSNSEILSPADFTGENLFSSFTYLTSLSFLAHNSTLSRVLTKKKILQWDASNFADFLSFSDSRRIWMFFDIQVLIPADSQQFRHFCLSFITVQSGLFESKLHRITSLVLS